MNNLKFEFFPQFHLLHQHPWHYLKRRLISNRQKNESIKLNKEMIYIIFTKETWIIPNYIKTTFSFIPISNNKFIVIYWYKWKTTFNKYWITDWISFSHTSTASIFKHGTCLSLMFLITILTLFRVIYL